MIFRYVTMDTTQIYYYTFETTIEKNDLYRRTKTLEINQFFVIEKGKDDSIREGDGLGFWDAKGIISFYYLEKSIVTFLSKTKIDKGRPDMTK